MTSKKCCDACVCNTLNVDDIKDLASDPRWHQLLIYIGKKSPPLLLSRKISNV